MHFWAKTTPDGKPGISVFDHLVNVGIVAQFIAEKFPMLLHLFKMRSNEVGALAALHDLGKIAPGFQQKCEEWLVENGLLKIARNSVWDTSTESDHGKVSHAAIQDFLSQSDIPGRSAKYLAAALGGHHGRLKYLPNDRGIKPPLIKQITDGLSGIDWHQERMTCAQKIWQFFNAGDALDSLTDSSPAVWWLAGLTSVADWIGSDERFFPADSRMPPRSPIITAHHALETIGFSPFTVIQDLSFEKIFEFPPNDMQIKSLKTIKGPGVYIIEAPMGLGKTEAALGAAYHLLSSGQATGIYFALPTQATSNRIHLRMDAFLRRILSGSAESRLIHSSSWLLKENLDLKPTSSGSKERPTEDARTGRDWFASAKRALLAPFGVGTIDQALLGIVAAKHFFVRHFALAGKVVILDEVHSYDLYTGTLIDALIATLEKLGCTVIVLSATLTKSRRDQIVCSGAGDADEESYPLITGRVEDETLPPVAASPPESRNVKVDFITADSAVERALAVAREGGAVLWICNTVDKAQKYFTHLKSLVLEEFPIGLLHSRHPHWRREELEKEWMERFGKYGSTRCGSVLVATQVVEQSVDLDSDLLITELAPTDMLLQRLGRLWRHERQTRPTPLPRVCIIDEEVGLGELCEMQAHKIKKALGAKSLVYDPYILLRSLEVWKRRRHIRIPEEIRKVIEETYLEREDEAGPWQELYFENLANSMAYRQKALMSSNVWQAALDDREGVQTRLNETPSVSLVLCRHVEDLKVQFVDGTNVVIEKDIYNFSAAKAIHRNLVKVPEHCFDRISPCSYFSEYIFENHCVGIVANNGDITVSGLKINIRLHYSNNLGLYIERSSTKEEV